MAGYSGTPLAKKLGIKAGSKLFVSNGPANYNDLLAPWPDGVVMLAALSPQVDIAHVFVTLRADLALQLKNCKAKLRDDAVVWVSWPKKSSKVATDITEDVIRTVALPMGLVDIKVCAIDEVWSGLKLVVRKENRKPRT
jgi:hypothetical protein